MLVAAPLLYGARKPQVILKLKEQVGTPPLLARSREIALYLKFLIGRDPSFKVHKVPSAGILKREC